MKQEKDGNARVTFSHIVTMIVYISVRDSGVVTFWRERADRDLH